MIDIFCAAVGVGQEPGSPWQAKSSGARCFIEII